MDITANENKVYTVRHTFALYMGSYRTHNPIVSTLMTFHPLSRVHNFHYRSEPRSFDLEKIAVPAFSQCRVDPCPNPVDVN